MGTVEKGLPIPTWLDHEFLYILNYGSTEPDVLKKTERSHSWVFRGAPITLSDKHFETRRTEITLMDRSLAAKLHNALYDNQSSPSFLTDWSPDIENRQISPFEYDPLSVQTFILVFAENFIYNCVWDQEYSSRILGVEDRPPMAAVVADMIQLIHFFKSKDDEDPKSVVEWI